MGMGPVPLTNVPGHAVLTPDPTTVQRGIIAVGEG